jgi:hypothetical protein
VPQKYFYGGFKIFNIKSVNTIFCPIFIIADNAHLPSPLSKQWTLVYVIEMDQIERDWLENKIL